MTPLEWDRSGLEFGIAAVAHVKPADGALCTLLMFQRSVVSGD